MADLHERGTYVTSSSGSSRSAWIFGALVAALAILGIWWFAATSPGTAPVTSAPEGQIESQTTAPAAPADAAGQPAETAPAE